MAILFMLLYSSRIQYIYIYRGLTFYLRNQVDTRGITLEYMYPEECTLTLA